MLTSIHCQVKKNFSYDFSTSELNREEDVNVISALVDFYTRFIKNIFNDDDQRGF